MHAIYNSQFQCEKCLSKYAHRTDATTMTEKIRKTKGCYDHYSTPIHTVQQAVTLKYKTCIGNFYSYPVVSWAGAHAQYEKGIMPFKGGYMEQPAKAIDILNIISELKNQQKELLNEQAKSRSRNKVRSIRGR